MTDVNSGEYFPMLECRIRAVIDDFYQCQIHRSDCGHATPCGSIYLCLSDLRREYSDGRKRQEIKQLESLI
jgi:hypothetical protein